MSAAASPTTGQHTDEVAAYHASAGLRPVPTTVHDAAFWYFDNGVMPVPLKPRTKTPALNRWSKQQTMRADLDGLFPADQDQNIGLRLGEFSEGLVDADLDCREAICVARHLLPPTGLVSGHSPTAPRSHYFYQVSDPPPKASEGFTDPLRKDKLCELRSTGGQTMVPPSVWVDDEDPHHTEPVVWEQLGRPAQLFADTLRAALGRVAAAALLARYWPTGCRHDLAGAVAGGLLRAGWSVEDTSRFLAAVAEAAGDSEGADRQRIATDTAAKLKAGAPVSGWPKAAEYLGEQGETIIRQVRTWLRVDKAKSSSSTPAEPRRVTYRPLLPYRPFPVNALPPVLRELVRASSEAIGCDPALVTLPALAAVAGCVGNSRALTLKNRWSEPAVVWALTVAESGGHKTPGFDAGVAPVVDLQFDLFEQHREAVKKWKKEDNENPEKKPQEPPTYVTSDATIEAIGAELQDNPHGLLLARDELDAWFQSFTRYKGRAGGTDRPQWLELHRAGTLIQHRITREGGHLAVRRAAVSVTGTIQPAILAGALDSEALAAGLGARFLLAMPPRRKRVWSEFDIPDRVAAAYRQLLIDLLALPLEDKARRKPYYLGLSRDAKRLWVEFYNQWGEVQFNSEGAQAAANAKVEAYAARLALIHHVVTEVVQGSPPVPLPDGGDAASTQSTAKSLDDIQFSDLDRFSVNYHPLRSVTEVSVAAGIELARWFAAEAVRIYAMLREGQQERETRTLVEWIQVRGGHVTVRQLQNGNSRKWPSSDLAEAALQGLVAGGLGYWEEEPAPRGGHGLRRFVLTVPTSDTSDIRPDGGGALAEGGSDTRSDTHADAHPQRNGACSGTAYDGRGCAAKAAGEDEGVSEGSDVGNGSGGGSSAGAAPEQDGQMSECGEQVSDGHGDAWEGDPTPA
jgi:hypothetical protein